MHLMDLTNFDKIILGIYILIILFIAYYLRYKKNDLSIDNIFYQKTLYYDIQIGIIEFVIFSVIGAKYGLFGTIIFLLALFISWVVKLFIKQNFSQLFNEANKLNNLFLIIIGVVCLLLSATGLYIVSSILQFLLGFKLISSIVFLDTLLLIIILIGARQAIIMITKMNLLMSILLISIICMIIIIKLYMHNVFIDYTIFKKENILLQLHNAKFENLWLILCISGFLLLNIINNFFINNTFVIFNNTQFKFISLLQIVIFILFGILSLITYYSKIDISNNKYVETYQTEMPNSEITYTVRMVDKNFDDQKGIIPKKYSANNQYNYLVAAITAINFYLPKQFDILAVIFVFVLFVSSNLKYMYLGTFLVTQQLLKKFSKILDTDNIQIVFQQILLIFCIITGFIAVLLNLNFFKSLM